MKKLAHNQKSAVEDFIYTHIESKIDRLNEQIEYFKNQAQEADDLSRFMANNLKKVANLEHQKELLELYTLPKLKGKSDEEMIEVIRGRAEDFIQDSGASDEAWTKHQGSRAWEEKQLGNKVGCYHAGSSLKALLDKLESLNK